MLYILGLLVTFILLYVIAAYLLSTISVNKNKTQSTNNYVEIYILSNGVHTDIVVPVKNQQADWSREIKFEHTSLRDSLMQYLAFGWGDKGFYLQTPNWSDLKFTTAFKAMFYFGQSAIHTTFYKEMTENESCVKIKISNEEYQKLIEYLKQSFKRNAAGNIIHIENHSYGNHDAFYEANKVYGLFYTCNTWTNDGLKYCGQRACLWTPFDKGIFYQYRPSVKNN